jgi:Peptidase family M28
VLGYLPAAKPTKETILIMGHWDHLGYCRPEGAEDRICNGAVDNASGIAVMIEVAKRLGQNSGKGPALDRNVLFFATTAEERGLLGAFAFATNPPSGFPLDGIVAALNIDTIAIADRGAPVAIIGRGTTNLDKAIDKIAKQLGRKIDSDLDANAFIQRQDGWALASKNVPTAMIGGSFSDLNKLEAFLGSTYHGPDDELVDSIPLGGAAEDADLHVALVRYLGNRKTWKKTVMTPSPAK